MKIRVLKVERDHPIAWSQCIDNRLRRLHFELLLDDKVVQSADVQDWSPPP